MQQKRTHLYVPFEEQEQVKALGACLDEYKKCRYIDAIVDSELFKHWLGDADSEEGKDSISSDHACGACANSVCWKCRSRIEVIAIYCAEGISEEEETREFTVFNITGIDDALSAQLKGWPQFRKGSTEDSTYFANYCPHCGVMQEDNDLHVRPDGVLFGVGSIPSDSVVTLTPLTGLIQLNGDEGYAQMMFLSF
jgi:hypothetical protein